MVPAKSQATYTLCVAAAYYPQLCICHHTTRGLTISPKLPNMSQNAGPQCAKPLFCGWKVLSHIQILICLMPPPSSSNIDTGTLMSGQHDCRKMVLEKCFKTSSTSLAMDAYKDPASCHRSYINPIQK